MAELLVDTDIFIDHLRGARRLAPGEDHLWYSTVTRCELFAGSRADEPLIRRLLGPFTEVAVDRAVAELAGRLRREFGVRIADALIAATALEHRLAVVTRNLRDFQRVPHLLVQPPAS